MRSLLLTSSFPPTLGGVETLLYETARRLPEPPLVLAPMPASAPDVRVLDVRTSPRGLAGRAAYQAQWRLHPSLHYLAAFWQPALRAAQAERPEVLQCGHVLLGPLAWLLARRLRVPYVVYGYGQELPRRRRQGLAMADEVLRGGVLRQADALLCSGPFVAGLFEERGADSRRIQVVPFGANLRPLAPLPESPRLLSVARLVPRKGIDSVIRAVAALRTEFPQLRYRVVGGGPMEPALRALAADLGVAGQVDFLGRVPDAVLAEEYQRASLFVLPTRQTPDGEFEGFGLAPLEASAWGRAVIAGTTGGERDAVVDGETGLLVDGTCQSAVTAALRALLHDPARLQRMGEAGWRRVRDRNNWDNAARVVQQTLECVVAARQ